MQRGEPAQRPRRLGGISRASAVGVGYRGLGPQPAWVSERERVAPVDLAFDRVLIDTPDLVAFVAAVHVYPSGFSFTFSSRMRPTASAAVGDAFAEEFSHGLEQPVPAEEAERGLRLGVRLADGRGAAFNPNHPWVAQADPEPYALPTIHSGRRSSDFRIFECELWVFDLPEEGDVTLFYRWLALGVPEASVVFDGDALRAAAARAVVLWDSPTAEIPKSEA